MGYRYTFIADDVPRKYPKWFKDKWKDVVDFEPLHSKVECKNWKLMFEDLQKVMKEENINTYSESNNDLIDQEVLIVEMGEMGMVYRYKITPDEIKEEHLAYDWRD